MLECLLRHNEKINYSCKIGTCQTCLLKSENSEIPPGAQTGLPKNLVKQKYFLSCLLYPEFDLTISNANEKDLFRKAKTISKQNLSDSVLQLILEPDGFVDFFAGQFINLKADEQMIRSYSMASNPAKYELIELHIKRMPNGKMSNWLFDELQVGDEIEFQGPNGNSFYNKDNLVQPMLLIGTGTGLAPLLSITRSAIGHGHRGEIVLYHGTRHSSGLYLNNELLELSSKVNNFSYNACLSGDIEFNGPLNGRANELALQKHKDLTGWQVFLCGEPQMVKETQKRAYLAGANLDEIHLDPFNLRDLRKRSRKKKLNDR